MGEAAQCSSRGLRWWVLACLALVLAMMAGPAIAAPPTAASGAASGSAAPAASSAASADDDSTTATAPGTYTPLPAKMLPSLAGRPGKVVVIPIHGPIDPGLARFLARSLEAEDQPAVIILDVDTFGGRVDSAVKMRDALLAAKVPTIAYVNRRAISAGALISLAADHIVVTGGATMGAATPILVDGGKAKPVAEKMVSYMRSEMRATAEAKGRDGEIAEAMVDADVEIPGLIRAGKTLTLTTDTALSTRVATARVETLDELVGKLGLADRPRRATEQSWGEGLTRFLTSAAVSGLLLSVGLLFLWMEVYQPGFGLPGIVGIVLLALFFGGHLFAELAGWEEIALFVLGVVLIIIEVFVTPGFGVLGVAGIACMVVGAALAMVGADLSLAWNTGRLVRAAGWVTLSLVVSLIALPFGIGVLQRLGRLPKDPQRRWLVLDVAVAGTATSDGPTVEAPDRLVGTVGIAATALRPSGKAELAGERRDVVCDLAYVDKGTAVRVVDVEGSRIVVTPVTDKKDAPEGA